MLYFILVSQLFNLFSKEAQRAAKGNPPSGQAVSEEPKVTKDPVKEGSASEPTKSKSELKAERRAKQV